MTDRDGYYNEYLVLHFRDILYNPKTRKRAVDAFECAFNELVLFPAIIFIRYTSLSAPMQYPDPAPLDPECKASISIAPE